MNANARRQGLWSIPGDGVLARQGDLVLLSTVDERGLVEKLLDLLAAGIENEADGQVFTGAVQRLVQDDESWGSAAVGRPGPAVIAFGPAEAGMAVVVTGTAWVDVTTDYGTSHLTAGQPSAALRCLLGAPVHAVRGGLGAGGNASDRTDRFSRLDSGSIRAGGLSYRSGLGAAADLPHQGGPPDVPAWAAVPAGPAVPEVPAWAATPAGPALPDAPAEPAEPAEPVASEVLRVFRSAPPWPPAPQPESAPPGRPAAGPTANGVAGADPGGRAAAGHEDAGPGGTPPPDVTPQDAQEQDPAAPGGALRGEAPRGEAPRDAPEQDAAAQDAPEQEAAAQGGLEEDAAAQGVPEHDTEPQEPAPEQDSWEDAAAGLAGTGLAGTGLAGTGLAEPPGDGAAPRWAVTEPAGEFAASGVADGPAATAGPAGDDAQAPIVIGVYCKHGHFGDPEARSCAVCGASRSRRGPAPEPGPRPPLGALVLADGSAVDLDTDCVIGRDPSYHPAVNAGEARPVVIGDPELTVSRVHARIHLDGWQVLLTDLGSANGTRILPPGKRREQELQPNVPVRLEGGTQVLVGVQSFRYETSGGW